MHLATRSPSTFSQWQNLRPGQGSHLSSPHGRQAAGQNWNLVLLVPSKQIEYYFSSVLFIAINQKSRKIQL